MSHNNKAVCLVSSEGSSGSRAVCGMGRGGETLTVGVGTDEDPDATAGGDVVRRQGVDVAADSRPAQRRLPRAGLPAPHSRRPHGGRLPAWLLDRHTNAHAHTRTHTYMAHKKGTLVGAARGAHAGIYRQTCMFARRFPWWSIHTRTGR